LVPFHDRSRWKIATLLDELIARHPDPFELPTALAQRARCLRALERFDDVLDASRLAAIAEREHPVKSRAGLDYAELVLRLQSTERYREALSWLQDDNAGELFPGVQFRSACARAFLCERLGLRDVARQEAAHALTAASKTESPFRHHRRLGLVDSLSDSLRVHLQRLAEDSA
jgi:hypothetical protein